MSWNYRVMKETDGCLGIHEVYYNDVTGKPEGWTERAFVIGDDLDELRSALAMMLAALEKDVLDMPEEKP